VLLDEQGRLQQETFLRLIDLRDDKPVVLNE
jgi:hypothetical protein